MRVLIFIASVVAAAIGFPSLIAHDTMRRRNFLKDGAPDADDSYERVRAKGRTYHDLKNVAVEWVRADPQLAAKFMAFVALAGWALAAVLLVLR